MCCVCAHVCVCDLWVACVSVCICVGVLLACALCGMFECVCTYVYTWCVCAEYDVCGICVSACDAYAYVQIHVLCICVCGMCVYVWCVYVYVCEVYVLCVCSGYVVYVCLRIVYACEFCVWFGGMYVYGGLLINMLLLKKKCLQFLSPPIHAPLCSRVIFPKHKAELSLSPLKGKKRKKRNEHILKRLSKPWEGNWRPRVSLATSYFSRLGCQAPVIWPCLPLYISHAAPRPAGSTGGRRMQEQGLRARWRSVGPLCHLLAFAFGQVTWSLWVLVSSFIQWEWWWYLLSLGNDDALVRMK